MSQARFNLSMPDLLKFFVSTSPQVPINRDYAALNAAQAHCLLVITLLSMLLRLTAFQIALSSKSL